jgi:predicted amidohydrolase YtcJ
MSTEFTAWSAVERLGTERARWLYPFNTLLQEDVRVAGGSDCPMEPVNPLTGVQAAVAREFFPSEGISVEDALRMYTLDAAYASSEECVKGSIEEGKIADFTVLSSDPTKVRPGEIGKISSELTVVGGVIVARKDARFDIAK